MRVHEIVETNDGMGGLPSLITGFSLLSVRRGIPEATLRETKLGSAFSISLNGQGVGAVSLELVRSLSPDEIEAVLAHELCQIRNKDSVAKGSSD